MVRDIDVEEIERENAEEALKEIVEEMEPKFQIGNKVTIKSSRSFVGVPKFLGLKRRTYTIFATEPVTDMSKYIGFQLLTFSEVPGKKFDSHFFE